MGSSRSASLSQKTRLMILIIYLAGLFLTSKIALNSWLPPITEKGLWFYSALAALLLGNLIVTPFFTKPADAVSYAVAAIITLLAVHTWSSVSVINFDILAWSSAVGYSIFVLFSAFGSIALRSSQPSVGQRLSQSLLTISDSLGNPRAIFSVVFLFALVTYHTGVSGIFHRASCSRLIILHKSLQGL